MSMTKLKNTVKLRLADLKGHDRKFVLDAWLKSWKKSPFAGIIPNNLFAAAFFNAVEQLDARGMEVYILESVDPEAKIGFVAFERAAVPVLLPGLLPPCAGLASQRLRVGHRGAACR